MARLRVGIGDGVCVHELGEPLATLGRAAECDIVIDDPSVSRAHARFELEGGRWRVTDLDSSNGTTCNGQALRPWSPHLLEAGDIIGLAGVRVELDLADSDQSGAATMQSVPQRRIELTAAESEVLELLFCHYDEGRAAPRLASLAEIAERRFTSSDAVKLLLRSLYTKFELLDVGERNKERLALRAQEWRMTRTRY